MHIFDIPVNVLTEIINFIYVNDNNDIFNLLNTCKFFKNIPIKKFKLKIINFDKVNFNSIIYQKATNLVIRNITNYNNNLISFNIKNIKLLKYNNDPSIDYNIFYEKYLSQLINLTHLTLYQINYVEIFPENLIYLKLIRCSGNLNNLPKKLNTFYLEFDHYMSNYNINEYFRSLILPDTLENLTIKYNKLSSLNNSDLKLPSKLKSLYFKSIELPEELPESLEKIELEGSIKLDIVDENYFRNIKTLKLNLDERLINNQKLDNIFNQLINLEQLESGLSLLTKSNISLDQLSNLNKLKIDCKSNDNKNLFNKLNLNNITYLSIINISEHYVFDKNISSFNLTELYLNGYFNLKEQNFNVSNLRIIYLGPIFNGNITTSIKKIKVDY